MACSDEATVSSAPAEVVVDLAQAVEVAVEDEHLGVHADGHGGGREAGHAGAEDDDPGAAHAGHAAHQHARARHRAASGGGRPSAGAIRPATSLMGASSGSELSSRRTVS